MIPNTIKSIDDIKAIAALTPWVKELWTWKMYGEVKATYQGNLVLFNYTAKAQYAGRWNFFERVSRGLILNWCTGEIVARPFDKFFNLGEPCAPELDGDIVSVTGKVDGSLGILYRDNGYKIATRGSFTSDQALWATEWLNENVDLSKLSDEWTLLFEIIYPENRIVIDYGDFEGLVLLAIRNRHTGEYLSRWNVTRYAHHYSIATTTAHNFESMVDIVDAAASLDNNREGFVVQDSTGQRFKIKGDEYKRLHRLISGLSKKAVIKALMAGVYSEMVDALPDEWYQQCTEWKAEIDKKIEVYKVCIDMAYEIASQKDTRKEFALYVNEHAPNLSPYLFAVLDNRDYMPMLYKKVLSNA